MARALRQCLMRDLCQRRDYAVFSAANCGSACRAGERAPTIVKRMHPLTLLLLKLPEVGVCAHACPAKQL